MQQSKKQQGLVWSKGLYHVTAFVCLRHIQLIDCISNFSHISRGQSMDVERVGAVISETEFCKILEVLRN